MSKKNMFLLAVGYVAGWLAAAFYNKRKPEELQKDLKKSRKNWDGDFKVLFHNFIETHENMLDDLKSHVLTDENIAKFNEKKEELLTVVDSYKQQWQDLADELKTKWKDFLVEASDNLNKLYEEKKDEIDQIKKVAPEKAHELKEDAKELAKGTVDKLKEKVKK